MQAQTEKRRDHLGTITCQHYNETKIQFLIVKPLKTDDYTDFVQTL